MKISQRIYLYFNITFHKLGLLRLYTHSFRIIVEEQNINSICELNDKNIVRKLYVTALRTFFIISVILLINSNY